MYSDTLSLSVAEALLRTQRPQGKRPGLVDERSHGVVAISREAGALGETIGGEVAATLGCPAYGREIVERIAEELQQPPEQLRTLDERPTFWIEDWLSGMPGTPLTVSMDTYMRFLFATVRGMAEMGRCVIIGRGSPHMLSPERTLRVRVVADLADRVKRVQEFMHLSEREASHWVRTTDDERAAFVRRNFKVDVADPHAYELMVNSSRFSVADCAGMIVDAFARFEARLPQPVIT